MKHLQRNVLAMAVLGITLAWVSGAIAAETSLSESSKKSIGGGLCRYDGGSFAELDTTQFSSCVKLRKVGEKDQPSPVVLELTHDSKFATTCPVSIPRLNKPHGNCSPVAAEALQDFDVLRVNEWGSDKLELTILRKGESVFHRSQPRVFLDETKITLGGKSYTIGFHGTAKVKADPSENAPAVTVSYYVYLRNVMDGTRNIRWYEVEVFDETASCQAELPGTSTAASEVVDCKSTQIGIPLPVRAKVFQMPSGGGGEPPPRPR